MILCILSHICMNKYAQRAADVSAHPLSYRFYVLIPSLLKAKNNAHISFHRQRISRLR